MSDLISTARGTLATAESRIRGLIETALAKQRYSDVALLAPIAEGLLALERATGNGSGSQTVSEEPANQNWATADGPLKRTITGTLSRAEHSYPRFERHGDRLVKIAWSKKERREYEHRATADLIFRIAEVFERGTQRGKPFVMDAMMPFKTADGDEIPSYQAYLVLAWLRSLGLIEARGKDGYAVTVDNLRQSAEHQWNAFADAHDH
jgi:hypothetical protein